MSRRTARGNRYGLVLAGLLLLIGGGLALARGFGALEQVGWFGPAQAGAPLLSSTESRYAAGHGWVWYVLAAIAVVVALWALRWIAVQTRSDRIRRFQLERDRRHGITELPGAALDDAIGKDIQSYWGVHAATARLTNDPSRPRLVLTVAASHDADLGDLRRRIRTEAIPHARQALDNDQLTTLLTLHLDTGKARRRIH